MSNVVGISLSWPESYKLLAGWGAALGSCKGAPEAKVWETQLGPRI